MYVTALAFLHKLRKAFFLFLTGFHSQRRASVDSEDGTYGTGWCGGTRPNPKVLRAWGKECAREGETTARAEQARRQQEIRTIFKMEEPRPGVSLRVCNNSAPRRLWNVGVTPRLRRVCGRARSQRDSRHVEGHLYMQSVISSSQQTRAVMNLHYGEHTLWEFSKRAHFFYYVMAWANGGLHRMTPSYLLQIAWGEKNLSRSYHTWFWQIDSRQFHFNQEEKKQMWIFLGDSLPSVLFYCNGALLELFFFIGGI